MDQVFVKQIIIRRMHVQYFINGEAYRTFEDALRQLFRIMPNNEAVVKFLNSNDPNVLFPNEKQFNAMMHRIAALTEIPMDYKEDSDKYSVDKPTITISCQSVYEGFVMNGVDYLTFSDVLRALDIMIPNNEKIKQFINDKNLPHFPDNLSFNSMLKSIAARTNAVLIWSYLNSPTSYEPIKETIKEPVNETAADNWISVSDRKPTEADGEFLVYDLDKDVYIHDGMDSILPNVTHWQPLPKPPKPKMIPVLMEENLAAQLLKQYPADIVKN